MVNELNYVNLTLQESHWPNQTSKRRLDCTGGGERSEGYLMQFYSFKPSGYWERFVLFQFGWEL